MKKKNIILSILLTLLLMLATACSDGDYLNAIPEGSTALLSIDMAKAQDENGADKQRLLSQLLGVDNPKDCGIDLDAKLYLFESPDGSLGMAAKVSSADRLASMFNNMAGRSIATKVTEKRGFQFSVLRDSWVAGFSSKSLLVMGPVVGNAQAAMIQQVANYLSQDEEQGIKGTPMFEKLDSIGSSIAMVAQAQALPEKFVAPFTLGAPKDADASQVLIAAKLSVAEGCLRINGETFSFNKRIDAALKEAAQVFRPIQGDYAESMGASSVMGVFMNVEGGGFLKLLQQNKGLMALLTGINAAIDMDNILRSVDGDMAITVPVFGEKFDITMAAKLAKTDFLKDVDYWKRSCPKGGRIVDTGTNRYCYTDGQTTFHFGVSADRQFFAGSTAEIAAAAIGKSAQPLPEVVRQQISGKRMAAVVSLSGIDNEVAQSVVQLLEPLFGKLHTMVYVVGE
ncbi:MAG: DUF4836 family protein [Prevotella sp.]|nr:DUF4836 family protein [Prevotella sp.]